MQYDYSNFVIEENKLSKAYLQIQGITCTGCIIKIENSLKKQKQIKSARINFSTNRLEVIWNGDKNYINEIIGLIEKLGYKGEPFEYSNYLEKEQNRIKNLLIAVGVSGFASTNIMLFSVALWAGYFEGMEEQSKNLFNWLSLIIGVPAIIFCGKTFFVSGFNALKNFSTNIDVPISVGIILTTLISIQETFLNGKYVYFDSAIMLEFFLLLGRYFEAKTLGRAKEYASQLLQNQQEMVKVISDGKITIISPKQVQIGMEVLVPAGEKISVDGVVIFGVSEIDKSLISGEVLPEKIQVGSKVLSGTINLSASIKIRVEADYQNSFLANLIKIIEGAEKNKDKFTTFAEKTIKIYTPTIHILALFTFLGWVFIGHIAWQAAALIAVSVLIVTCPCALGLAVPVAHTIATALLFKHGVIRKSQDSLEKLSSISKIVFDKTGTLTKGELKLINTEAISKEDINLASSIAGSSNHIISRAIFALNNKVKVATKVKEILGLGLEAKINNKKILLGSAEFVGAKNTGEGKVVIYLKKPSSPLVEFIFSDELKPDAKQVIQGLKNDGYKLCIISGDNKENTSKIASEVGIDEFYFAKKPEEKFNLINSFKENLLMVGDGLNDLPAISASLVSISFASGSNITQKTSDFIIQGKNLEPLYLTIKTAKRTIGVIKQNIGLSLLYNVFAVPLAVSGLINPFLAAVMMSISSLTVTLNSFKIKRIKN